MGNQVESLDVLFTHSFYGLWSDGKQKWECLDGTGVLFSRYARLVLAKYHNLWQDFRDALDRGYWIFWPGTDEKAFEKNRQRYRDEWSSEGWAIYELGNDGLPRGEPLTDGKLE